MEESCRRDSANRINIDKIKVQMYEEAKAYEKIYKLDFGIVYGDEL